MTTQRSLRQDPENLGRLCTVLALPANTSITSRNSELPSARYRSLIVRTSCLRLNLMFNNFHYPSIAGATYRVSVPADRDTRIGESLGSKLHEPRLIDRPVGGVLQVKTVAQVDAEPHSLLHYSWWHEIALERDIVCCSWSAERSQSSSEQDAGYPHE